MARYDIADAPPLADDSGPWDGLTRFAEATLRIAQAPVLSIASIRGRARGGGSEIALACDLRFASRERANFGQPEVPFGLLPAGGAIERLARSAGRARALEIVIGGGDFDADLAERYGWINRAVPDQDLDEFAPDPPALPRLSADDHWIPIQHRQRSRFREWSTIADRVALAHPGPMGQCKRAVRRRGQAAGDKTARADDLDLIGRPTGRKPSIFSVASASAS